MNLKELIDYDEDEYNDEWAFFSIQSFGFEPETVKEINDIGRWTTSVSKVYKRVADETYWRFSWQEGNTECQEVDFDLDIEQVYPKQVTKTIYTSKQ